MDKYPWGPKTYGSCGSGTNSGSATLVPMRTTWTWEKAYSLLSACYSCALLPKSQEYSSWLTERDCGCVVLPCRWAGWRDGGTSGRPPPPPQLQRIHTRCRATSHSGISKRFIGNIVLAISIPKGDCLCVPKECCRTEPIYSGYGWDFGKVSVPGI